MESSTLTLREYDIRGASEREYAAPHAFFRRIESEERPDDPPESVEQLALPLSEQADASSRFTPVWT